MRTAGYRRKKRLGDLLVEVGVITEEQLGTALEMQKTEKKADNGGIAAAAWYRECGSVNYSYSG